jgi:hypothetical protein
MSLILKKKDGPVFVTDATQLERYLLTPEPRRSLMLGGQLLISSLEPIVAQPGFVAQQPRSAVGGGLTRRKGAGKLQLFLDKQTLEHLVRLRQRPRFAIDALVRYGLKLKGNTDHCVIGAFDGTYSRQVLVLTFKKQELTGYTEYQLASPHTYNADLQLLMGRLVQANASATFHWCGPVAAPASLDLAQPSSAIWSLAPAQPLTLTGKPSLLKQHGPAFGLVVMACAAYVGAMYGPYQEYQSARADLAQESAALKGETAFDVNRLSLLRTRQAFFETQKGTDQRFAKFIDVLAAFAQEPDVTVTDAILYSAQDPSRAARPGQSAAYEVVVEVPRIKGLSVLDQGKPLLQSLSTRTGGSLRLATGGGGYRESETTSGQPMRQYRIQGDLKNAS